MKRASVFLIAAILIAQDPSWQEKSLLFWPLERRDAGFRHMERIFESSTVAAGGPVHIFKDGPTIDLSLDIEAYMKSQRAAGLIIVQNDKVRLEKYALGYDASGRWASFSVAKSITSTLVGAAVKDGLIRSLDDKVTDYVKGLNGSPYDDVTVRQLMTMTSGMKWNEDYTDPNSDVVRSRAQRHIEGLDVTVSYMRQLAREAPAGSKWVYKTGETNLIDVLVSQATGKTLSAYLSEEIWTPYGMEQSAYWDRSASGLEMGGCCLSATLRDYARFGQFILDGARVGGKSILPPGWIRLATTKQVDTGLPGRGYGYQWWTNDDGTFQASGIFGQSIFIDSKRRLVIATNGNWPTATDVVTLAPARAAFFRAVQAAQF